MLPLRIPRFPHKTEGYESWGSRALGLLPRKVRWTNETSPDLVLREEKKGFYSFPSCVLSLDGPSLSLKLVRHRGLGDSEATLPAWLSPRMCLPGQQGLALGGRGQLLRACDPCWH